MTDTATLTFRARIGSDLTSARTTRGVPVVRFRIAVPQWRRTDSGDYEDLEPRWYTVRAWDRLAQNATTSLSKGQPVIVVGRPVSNAWVDSNGQIHSEIVINATAIGHDLSMGSAMFFKRGQAPNTEEATTGASSSPSSNEADAPPSSAEAGDVAVGEETSVERTHIGQHHADLDDDAFMTSPEPTGMEENSTAVDAEREQAAEALTAQGTASVFADAYSVGGAD